MAGINDLDPVTQIDDTDRGPSRKVGDTVDKYFTWAQIKAWIKSWITKTDVGLENVTNDAQVVSVQAGANVGVDATDPQNPIISATPSTEASRVTVTLHNATGADIPKGKMVAYDGAASGVTTCILADPQSENLETRLQIAMTDEAIVDGSTGTCVKFGLVTGVDTSGLDVNEIIWLSTTPGEITDSRPAFPALSEIVGKVAVSDVSGTVLIDTRVDYLANDFKGCIIERHDTTVLVDTGQVYVDVEKLGGGNLPVFLENDVYYLDCTTGSGVGGKARSTALVEGSPTAESFNVVWIELEAGTPVVKAGAPASVPTDGRTIAFVAYVSILDATTTNTEGPLAHQRTTDAVVHNGRGRISYIDERLRAIGAEWASRVVPSYEITTQPATLDDVNFSVTAGDVYQLHRQNFPARAVFTDGIYVANASGSGTLLNYQKLNNLNEVLEDSIGNSLAGSRYNLVIWGSINKETNECKLFVNLPNDSYGTDIGAYTDSNNTAIVSVPAGLKGTAFLIARLPLRHRTTGNGTITSVGAALGRSEIIDLRGTPLGVSGQGGAGAGTVFSDADFEIFNDVDNTKVGKFDASGVDTATTRTYGLPNSDGTLALLSDLANKLETVATDATLSGDGTVGSPLSVVGGGGGGDMLASTYDPTNIAGDAFARANHTGSQTASTISDFDTEVSNNTNVAANTAHAGNTSNPHSVTKTQVGLSNVPNTDATQRSNHTGTQPASTITSLPIEIGIAASDETTDLTTGVAKATFRVPQAITLTAVRASVTTAPTGANLVVDINEGGTTILSTKLSIDAGEKTSTTAVTPPVISDTSLADDAEITIDIDQIGSTVAGTGLKIWLIGTRT